MTIYLDNSATTRQYDLVTEEMLRWMQEEYGNPSSLHRMGLDAERGLKKARSEVAHLLGVASEEIVFTGSGTESDNTAIMGAAQGRRRRGNHIITTSVEHPAVLEACKRLSENGYRVDILPVDSFGAVRIEDLDQAITKETILVSVMTVNNELGTVEPIQAIGEMVKKKGDILFHSDGIQALGKLPIDLPSWQVDLFTISGHKIHGPKGTGALYVKKGFNLAPFLVGGGQERGLRSGTENTPALIGFGRACNLAEMTMDQRVQHMNKLRCYLKEGIRAEIPDALINSPELTWVDAGGIQQAVDPQDGQAYSSPSILNVSFLGCRGEVLLHSLEQNDIFVSTGAACSSRKKGSHVLQACDYSLERTDSAIRFSFSEYNSVEELDQVLEVLVKTVGWMRNMTRRL